MEIGAVYALHAIFFLFMDLFVFIKTFSKRKDSASQHTFSRFALAVIVLQFAGIGAVCVDYKMVNLPSQIIYFIFFVMVALPPISACLLNLWLSELYSIKANKWPQWIKIATITPVVIYTIMSATSQETHWIFFIDDQGNYQRGSMFFLQIAVPYAYILGFLAVMLREKLKGKISLKAKSIKYALLYIVPPIVGSYIQITSELKGCFTELGISAGLVLVYIGMYMGDAEEQRRLSDLAAFNEKSQAANKQMRTLLMRGELQAKTVAETIHGGFRIGRFDKYFTFKYISDQLANMLGYTVSEMKEVSGGNMAGMVDKEEVKRQLPEAFKRVSEGKMFTLNYKVRCKDGSWKYVEERGRVIKTEGAEDEIWSVTVDKDEMVRAEEALAREEASRKELEGYTNIISNAGLGVWYIYLQDGQKPRMKANKKMLEILGITETNPSEEYVYDFWYSRIEKKDEHTVTASVGEMMNGKLSENTYRWHHPTKGVVYTRCGGVAEKQDYGSIILSGYHGDVTDIVIKDQKQQQLLKEALSDAERSNNAKTIFLNSMSHDIRTPMNAIIGFSTLMEKDLNNPEKLKDYLKKIKSSGDFLLSLINNVLEMARIESGKAELNEQPSDLSKNTDVTMDIFDADVKARNLTITASMDIQHNFVYVDIVKMREILINLISNAIKYSKENGHIDTSMKEVPCAREGYAAYEFVIEDDGIGMSEEFLPHVFDSFVRERNSTESKIAGTGLGLPIVKKLVELMGGTISVESKLGVGTKFTTYFEHRICNPEDVETMPNVNPSEVKSLKGKRILLAEDNDLNAEIAETLLKDSGFLVERAADGAICVDMLKKADIGYYDVILMDVLMPNMNGYDATKAIRQLDNARKDIPIVAMTANAFAEDRTAAFNAGMNEHVAKPINMDVLMGVLSEIIR